MTETRRALIDRLAGYDRLVEVGVGRRPEVAAGLVETGAAVAAIDVVTVETPPEVPFVRDDVVARRDALDGASPGDPYRVDAVYGLNLPAELQRPTLDVARAAGADCLFTTLGFEEPVVPVARDRVGDETLYVARRRER